MENKMEEKIHNYTENKSLTKTILGKQTIYMPVTVDEYIRLAREMPKKDQRALLRSIEDNLNANVSVSTKEALDELQAEAKVLLYIYDKLSMEPFAEIPEWFYKE
jgi:hypothetical protein